MKKEKKRYLKQYMIGMALCSSLSVSSQVLPEKSFIPPFDFPLLLSGSFGELRANHFHGGLDFKTQGVVGKPIRCIADGYVSRVTVTHGGFGQAVYVTHPNGITSVYGHIKNFSKEVAAVVKEYQYANETFLTDLSFSSDQFPVKQGDIIALSGNEGYSFGPHLHLELHQTDTDEYINPMVFYKKELQDTKPPVAKKFVIYPQPGKGVVNGSAHQKAFAFDQKKSVIHAWGDIACGIQAFDYMDGTYNNYGVYSVKLSVDSTLVFQSQVDSFLPYENRMINAWTDFNEYIRRGQWYMRSQILPGNTWRMLKANQNGGIVSINEERDYHFKYELTDLHGNEQTYSFVVKGKETSIDELKKGPDYLDWKLSHVVQRPGMELAIPKGMLYDDVDLNVKVQLPDSAAISYTYQIHDEALPLHSYCPLSLAIRNYPVADTSKYYVAIHKKNRKSSVGGRFKDGWMNARVRELGTYSVEVDTIAPKVIPLNQPNWKKRQIAFQIREKETGIGSYKVYLDGSFILFGYSSKTGKLTLKDSQRIKKGVPHRLELWISDVCGNETHREYKF